MQVSNGLEQNKQICLQMFIITSMGAEFGYCSFGNICVIYCQTVWSSSQYRVTDGPSVCQHCGVLVLAAQGLTSIYKMCRYICSQSAFVYQYLCLLYFIC